MTTPRSTVTFGEGGSALTLVVDIGQYRPFGDVALGVTAFDGIEATTVQDFGFRADRQEGSLSSGSGTGPGLLATATLAALIALVTAEGVALALADGLGNAGTIKPLRFSHPFEYHVPGPQGALHSYSLTWRWMTLTTRYGAPYTGR